MGLQINRASNIFRNKGGKTTSTGWVRWSKDCGRTVYIQRGCGGYVKGNYTLEVIGIPILVPSGVNYMSKEFESWFERVTKNR